MLLLMDTLPFSRWIPTYPGHLYKGDKVRVLQDAFDEETLSRIHNGRVCVVLDAKDGDIIVASIDDRLPRLTDTRYPYYKLEKAV